jgi:hypothetical protein
MKREIIPQRIKQSDKYLSLLSGKFQQAATYLETFRSENIPLLQGNHH